MTTIIQGLTIPFIGFWLGVLFLLLLDHVIPHLHRSIEQTDQTEGPKANLNRTIMMVLAVTLHNIPEKEVKEPLS